MKTLTSICVVTIAALAILNAPEALPISGTEQPTVNLDATHLLFIYYPRCHYDYPETVTLTNDGPGVLDISRIAISNRDFSQTNTCGSTLAVGESCSITVTWNGESAGASLFITDNGVGSPQSVSLKGLCISFK